MQNLTPDHRHLAVLEAVEHQGQEPYDVDLARLFKFYSTRICEIPEIVYAHDLYANADHRCVLDAFLLSRMARKDISQTLGIPEAVLDKYATYYMDVNVFRNKLELISYANTYESTAYGRELVRVAVTVGPEYLLWAYGTGNQQLDARFVIRRTMVDSFFRGMAHKGNALTSNMAKEAQKWWATAIRNAEILERIDPHTERAAAEELRIALEGHDETVKPEQAPVPVQDILH